MHAQGRGGNAAGLGNGVKDGQVMEVHAREVVRAAR